MFGSTRHLAEAVAEGLGSDMDARVVQVNSAIAGELSHIDFLVVGTPTHAHSMPRASTRRGAPEFARKPGSDLVLEPGADSEPGVREWLTSLGGLHIRGAAFDTRVKGPPSLTGRASRGISKALEHHGVEMVAPPESFLVDKQSHLLPGEAERARAWAVGLASDVAHSAMATS